MRTSEITSDHKSTFNTPGTPLPTRKNRYILHHIAIFLGLGFPLGNGRDWGSVTSISLFLGLCPRTLSSGTAASACATGAAWRAALAVARSAARLSAAADVAAVNAAITACQRAQRWERQSGEEREKERECQVGGEP